MDKSVIKRLIIEKQRESETETRITGKSTEITVLPVWKWLLM